MTMTATPTITPDTVSRYATPAAPRRLDERRLAAIGALTFATIVVTTNILQGAVPAMDADAREVVNYLESHRAQSVFATAAYAIGTPFLLMFASAFYGRLRAVGRREDAVWARFGMIGALLITPMFAAVVLERIVLLVGHGDVIASPELVTLLWRLEMAAFALNGLPIAAAVLGFGIAGARAGLLPAWFARWAPVAAVVGIVGAACSVISLQGAPTGFLGFVPFISWMALLLIAGVRLLRSPDTAVVR
jgi:hypothetical protein